MVEYRFFCGTAWTGRLGRVVGGLTTRVLAERAANVFNIRDAGISVSVIVQIIVILSLNNKWFTIRL
jgi:hypothetical protein